MSALVPSCTRKQQVSCLMRKQFYIGHWLYSRLLSLMLIYSSSYMLRICRLIIFSSPNNCLHGLTSYRKPDFICSRLIELNGPSSSPHLLFSSSMLLSFSRLQNTVSAFCSALLRQSLVRPPAYMRDEGSPPRHDTGPALLAYQHPMVAVISKAA